LRHSAHNCWRGPIPARGLNWGRCGSSSFRSATKPWHYRPRYYARAARTDSILGLVGYRWTMPAAHGLWERPALSGVAGTTATVGHSAGASCCSGARTSVSCHDFHTDSQQNYLPLPRHYSFPCQTQVYQRLASHLPYSPCLETLCLPYQPHVPPPTVARSGCAAWIAAGATSAVETIADANCSLSRRNAVTRRCESLMEPQLVRSPTNWRAWARRAGCPSSSELRSAGRGLPP